MKRGSKTRAVKDRFWEKVDKSGDCWEWTAGCYPSGYGTIKISGRNKGAHRVAWEMENGEIPNGLCVLHKCDNRKCVRPDHLFVGTNAENVSDRCAKGRTSRAPRNRGENHGLSKLTESDINLIRGLVAAGVYQSDVGERFGIVQSCVSNIVHRRRWGHIR